MKAHNIRTALDDPPALVITSRTTEEEAAAAMRMLTPFNRCALGAVRFPEQTPGERHPDGDEILHVLEGEVDVTVLTDSGPVHETVHAGSLFVVPRGL
jgi:quercetin dioxygenase-like cupin family protein